jgi:hypothetical protein
MNPHRLFRVADPARLDALLDQVAGSVDAAERAALREHGMTKLRGARELARALAAPEDRDEFLLSLAAFWLELRFEWERHNRVANYTVVRGGGEADPVVMARAALCSGLLGVIEEIVPDHDVDALGRAAVALLDRAREELAAGEPLSGAVPTDH